MRKQPLSAAAAPSSSSFAPPTATNSNNDNNNSNSNTDINNSYNNDSHSKSAIRGYGGGSFGNSRNHVKCKPPPICIYSNENEDHRYSHLRTANDSHSNNHNSSDNNNAATVLDDAEDQLTGAKHNHRRPANCNHRGRNSRSRSQQSEEAPLAPAAPTPKADAGCEFCVEAAPSPSSRCCCCGACQPVTAVAAAAGATEATAAVDGDAPPSSALLPNSATAENAAARIGGSHQNSVSASCNSRFGNSRDYFSAFQQQQQFAFFPNASEKVMANTRRIIVLSIYVSSMVLSIVLFLLTAVYCQITSCSVVWTEKNRQYAQLFPICASCLIAFLSMCWLIANFRRIETSCMRDYSFLEMPSAVLSSLLAGVCAVIEIHYNFDYSYLYWSEKWALAAADSVILVFLHAGLAFALT